MKNYTKWPHVQAFAEELRKAGYTIIAPEKTDYTWLWAVKGTKIINFSADRFEQFRIGTEHIPSHKHGSGYSLHRNIYNPTVELIDEAMMKPYWASNHQVKFYKSIEHFMEGHKWCKPYIVTDELVEA